MIEVKGLMKFFGPVRAVNGISFSVPSGQILGFLGPNGAGKSTTMKILTCFLEPSSGTAKIGGKDVLKDSLAVRRLIGYLPESAPSYGEMTVAEFLTFIAEMRGLTGSAVKNAAHRMREVCFLESVWHQAIETLSKGYRQRVGFAQALIHDPPVLVLDEPTDGLDPNQKHEVRELIKRMGRDKTIILSTHILEEVEAICERAIIIASGSIVADASPAKLREQSSTHNAVTLQFAETAPERAKEALQSIAVIDHVEPLALPNSLRVFPRDGQSIIATLSNVVRDKGWKVNQLTVEQGRLDEVFRNITKAAARKTERSQS
jgi:ABC-2 type transport system ATP-binding protein